MSFLTLVLKQGDRVNLLNEGMYLFIKGYFMSFFKALELIKGRESQNQGLGEVRNPGTGAQSECRQCPQVLFSLLSVYPLIFCSVCTGTVSRSRR